jgi:hypothetical protein
MNKKISYLFVLILLASPLSVFAQIARPIYPTAPITDFWCLIVAIINFIWPIFAGIAILIFIYVGLMFLTARGEPGKVKTAREAVIWGVVGIIVALLAYALVLTVTNLVAPGGAGGGGAGCGAPVAPALLAGNAACTNNDTCFSGTCTCLGGGVGPCDPPLSGHCTPAGPGGPCTIADAARQCRSAICNAGGTCQ